MKKWLYAFLFTILLVGSFLAGSWFNSQKAFKSKASGVKPELFTATDAASESQSSSTTPGTVKISLERRQAIGVRVGVVEIKPVTQTVRILGRVATDETRIYRLNAAVEGWIRDISHVTTGTLVKKNEPLASYYSTEFLSAIQAYLFAVGSLDRFQASEKEVPEQIALVRANMQQYIDTLKNLGMGDLQIEEITRTRKLTQNIQIFSPADGFILFRNVSPGEKFEKGKELFRIADLSRVWILADIYENEAQHLQPGKTVKCSTPNQRKTFNAKVSSVLPQFDPATRTLKVRLEADNPGYVLRPDMFVDVEMPISLPPGITVPVDAVLDSGLKKTVFVDLGNGVFEPREVETGWRIGNQVEIARGLKPGERIVISGTFMIDSESRLELAAAGMVGTLAKDPVCGVDVSINKAEKTGRKSIYQGKTYYFSSDECKEKFEKNPSRYVK